LAAEPEILVLDEAVAALDVSIQAQILNLLADLRTALAVTYVFVTHDLAVVRQVADRVLVLHRGKIVEEGTVTKVLDSPEHDYTKRLIASAPSRILAANVSHKGGAPERPQQDPPPTHAGQGHRLSYHGEEQAE
jgi:ABC-type oligopeptide transport system ATPase subunit